jgi:hypothetical protein
MILAVRYLTSLNMVFPSNVHDINPVVAFRCQVHIYSYFHNNGSQHLQPSSSHVKKVRRWFVRFEVILISFPYFHQAIHCCPSSIVLTLVGALPAMFAPGDMVPLLQ